MGREFFTTGVHFCLGEENSSLYYRSAFLSWRREFVTTGLHFCVGEENSLLQECISVLERRIRYYRSAGRTQDAAASGQTQDVHSGSRSYTAAAGRTQRQPGDFFTTGVS